jgi:hypothetical protein
VLDRFNAMGPAGSNGAVLVEGVLRLAAQAASSGDHDEMLRVYQEMKDIEA